MMKRIFIFCFVILLTVSSFSSVCAADATINYEVNITDATKSIISVDGTIIAEVKENRFATIGIVPKDGVFDTKTSSSALAFTIAEIDKDGKFNCTLGFEKATDEYDCIVLYDGFEKRLPFKFISIVDVVAFISDIKKGNIAQSDIAQKIIEYNSGLGVNMSDFTDDYDENLLEYRIYTNRSSISDESHSETIESFYSLVDLAKAEKEFMKKLNAVTYSGDYYKILSENLKYTKLDFTKYSALSSNGKSYVAEAFLGKVFKNADEIKPFFDAKVLEAPDNNDKDSGNSIGGSSGGGGGTYRVDDAQITQPIVPQMSFNDISDVPWAIEAVEALWKAGVIDGVTNTQYAPYEPVTREQFAKLVVATCGLYNENAKCNFNDVNSGDWFATYVGSAVESGLITGKDDGSFGTGEYITREDMAVVIRRAFGLKKKSFDKTKKDFTDVDSISEYAKQSVFELAGSGIINGMGDGRFAPKENANRAQAAVLVYSLLGR